MVRSRKAKESPNTPVIPLEQGLPEIPDRKAWEIPLSYLESDGQGGYREVKTRRSSQTLLVNQIRREVDSWRESGYLKPSGISDTSRRLLEFWFEEEHLLQREIFHFRFAQREAIETAIYLYEVKNVRDNAMLVEKYMSEDAYGNDLFTQRKEVIETAQNKRILKRLVPATGQFANQDLPPEGLTRYCCKSATGSGKTFVMAFLAVWSYFHRKFEPDSPMSQTILVIAPNVIVYERLKSDFENGQIFRDYPFIPDEWKYDWQMSFIMRGDQVKSSSDGTYYLTNIHQIYESRANEEDDLGPVGNLLGAKPQKDSSASWLTSLYQRIQSHSELLVINDEAHHVHDEDLAWYKSILAFHENLLNKTSKGLSLLFDLTATPKDQNGTFFPWIISDYPLAQAIEDRIVKTPLIVHQTDKSSPDNRDITNAYDSYQEWIQIALSRYGEHEACYGELGQKPVLFIMAEDTRQADQIAEGLRNLAEFSKSEQVLVIHTKNDGSEKNLDKAREAARKIDNLKSQVKIVVSVLMLREGWDVKNVSIILGLRPFTSKAEILPEQAVGRGLRLMQNLGPDYTQILEIIGTDKFEEFVRRLETEGVGLGITRSVPSLGEYIYPLKTRLQYNFEIPSLSSSFTRKLEGLSHFYPSSVPPIGKLSDGEKGRTIGVELVAATTSGKVASRQVVLEDNKYVSSQQMLGNICNRVLHDSQLNGKFNDVYRILKQYVQNYAFGRKIDLEELNVRRILTDSRVSQLISQTLSSALGQHCRVETKMEMTNYPISLMELPGFLWKRQTVGCHKTIFNFTPVYNQLEKEFAEFLDSADDITKFAALAETYTRFCIPYLNKKGGQSLYYPDFIAEQRIGSGELITWIIETKGYEDDNVALKDAEADHWCQEVSQFVGNKWHYIKVPDRFFRNSPHSFLCFEDLICGLQGSPRMN